LKEVGRGGFAVVFDAVNTDSNEHFAMKRFLLDSIDAESLGQIEVPTKLFFISHWISLLSSKAEIDLMKKLNHPNIVKYVDTIRTEGYLYVVLE
jgi:serine/threonine protein kinase